MSDEPQASRALANIDPKKVNALLPTTDVVQVSPFHKFSITTVQASANPLDGDVYKQGSTKVGGKWVDLLSPSKVLLEKFAKAAGITWDPRQSGPVTPSVCQKCQLSHQAVGKPTPCVGCPHEYDVAHRAVGAIQTPTGQFLVKDAVYELDFVALEEEALLNEQDKNTKREASDKLTDEQMRIKVKKAMAQKRRHRVALAETGAHDRVIRKVLSTKSTYTAAELAKPFAVPQIGFSPDLSDPETRRTFVVAAAKAQFDVFGSRREINITPEDAAEAEATAGAMRGAPMAYMQGEDGVYRPPDTRRQPAEPESDESLGFEGEILTEDEEEPATAGPTVATEPGAADATGDGIPVLGRDYLMCMNPDCPQPEIWRVDGMTCEQMQDELLKHFGKILCRPCRQKQNHAAQAQLLP